MGNRQAKVVAGQYEQRSTDCALRPWPRLEAWHSITDI